MASRLSQELVDQCIDHLHSDSASLLSCAMTCQSFRPASQFHIFTTVRIARPHQLSSFLAALESSPVLGFHVQDLMIDMMTFTHTFHWQTLVGLSEALPRVESLALSYVTWVGVGDSPLLDSGLWSGRFQNVRSLTLDACAFSTLREFVLVLASLPALETLAVSRNSWLFYVETHDASNITTCITATSLCLDRVFPDLGSAALFVGALNRFGVRRAEMRITGDASLHCLRDICVRSLSQLEQVKIVVDLPGQTPLLHRVDLSRNPSLSKLDVRFIGRRLSDANARTWMVELLRSSTSTKLEQVIFRFDKVTMDNLAHLPWRDVKHTLRDQMRQEGGDVKPTLCVVVHISLDLDLRQFLDLTGDWGVLKVDLWIDENLP